MKILVIGNGFDLAHKLPTSYNDFLFFLRLVFDYNEHANEKIIKYFYEDDKTVVITDNYKLQAKKDHTYIGTDSSKKIVVHKMRKHLFTLKKEYLNKLKKLEENYWIKNFLSSSAYRKEGWVDFEREIQKEIEEITNIELDQNNNPSTSKTLQRIKERLGLERRGKDISEFCKEVATQLEEQLEDLRTGLEIYLDHFVNNIDIDVEIPEILDGAKFDFVISFNYTNTFERLYKDRMKAADSIEYIHGKADLSRTDNNMVLGIDEFLKNGLENSELTFIAFRKYFQRIVYGTARSYRHIISPKKARLYEVHIYGHSMDLTDRKILKEVIESTFNDIEIKTTVYHHNTFSHHTHVQNLVRLLEVEKLTEYIHGNGMKRIYLNQQHECVLKSGAPPTIVATV